MSAEAGGGSFYTGSDFTAMNDLKFAFRQLLKNPGLDFGVVALRANSLAPLVRRPTSSNEHQSKPQRERE